MRRTGSTLRLRVLQVRRSISLMEFDYLVLELGPFLVRRFFMLFLDI